MIAVSECSPKIDLPGYTPACTVISPDFKAFSACIIQVFIAFLRENFTGIYSVKMRNMTMINIIFFILNPQLRPLCRLAQVFLPFYTRRRRRAAQSFWVCPSIMYRDSKRAYRTLLPIDHSTQTAVSYRKRFFKIFSRFSIIQFIIQVSSSFK